MSDAPAMLEVPHPRASAALLGHEKTLAQIVRALASGRMPHAIILAGPQGIGKATLAYRIARYVAVHGLSGEGPADLGVSLDAPSSRLILQESYPDLLVLTRPYDPDKKRFKADLPIDEIRRLHHFLSQHAAMGGARVAIIDAADDMNRNAANALLKVLEEPPRKTLLILISHAPGALLPTIKSRCRMFRMQPLDAEAMARVIAPLSGADPARRHEAALLADGSPGRALDLLERGGLELHASLLRILSGAPRFNARAIHAFASEISGRGSEDPFALFGDLLLGFLRRALLAAGTGAGEGTHEEPARSRFAALGVEGLGELWDKLSGLISATEYASLDRKQSAVQIFALMVEAFGPQNSRTP